MAINMGIFLTEKIKEKRSLRHEKPQRMNRQNINTIKKKKKKKKRKWVSNIRAREYLGNTHARSVLKHSHHCCFRSRAPSPR
jgi:hypothetical protein